MNVHLSIHWKELHVSTYMYRHAAENMCVGLFRREMLLKAWDEMWELTPAIDGCSTERLRVGARMK